MRLAYFSPLNPKPSGISDYSEALLPHLLSCGMELDVFVDDYKPSLPLRHENLRFRNWRQFEEDHQAGRYDSVLYHIGNNPYHIYIYDLAVRIPGILVLHEFNIHYLFADATITRQDWEGYIREVEYNAGPAAADKARRIPSGEAVPDYTLIPMNRRLLENSQGAIVHSDYMVRLIKQSGYKLPVCKIPHGVEIPDIDEKEARRKLASLSVLPLDDAAIVIGVFGFLKPYKRIRETLLAFSRIHREFPNSYLILGGEEHPDYPLKPLIDELRLQNSVRILGYIPVNTFVEGLAACDMCINLRYPTAGETSGSFLRALGLGKPSIVSDIGSFQDMPEDVAIRIPAGNKEVDWLYEYMKLLIEDSGLRLAISARARDFASAHCAWPVVANQYVSFLKQMATAYAPADTPVSGVMISTAPSGNHTSPRMSIEELEDYIVGFSQATPLMEEYALVHLKRLIHTVQITPPGGPDDRVLEMGCYMQMTPALRAYSGYGEVRGAYFGDLGDVAHQKAVSITGEIFECEVDLFNAEKDRYPYPDGQFQTILCCELLEHLAFDPMHMMAEINRILAHGGHLVLSTPNICSYRSVNAVLYGYHPGLFQAYIKPKEDGTVDPRHSREYAPREIAGLMEAAGFQVRLLETGNYAKPDENLPVIQQMLMSIQCSQELRGDVIYCVGQKTGPVRDRWPKGFYYPP